MAEDFIEKLDKVEKDKSKPLKRIPSNKADFKETESYSTTLEQRLIKLEEKLEEKKVESDIFEPIKRYGRLSVTELNAQLPIFTSTPTHTGKEGEMVLLNDGTYYRICVYMNGTWRIFGLDYVELMGAQSGIGGGASTETWLDWDLSASYPAGARYVEVIIESRINNAEYVVGVRKKGSSEDRYTYIGPYSQVTMTAELDDDRVLQRYTSDHDVTFKPIGYWI